MIVNLFADMERVPVHILVNLTSGIDLAAQPLSTGYDILFTSDEGITKIRSSFNSVAAEEVSSKSDFSG